MRELLIESLESCCPLEATNRYTPTRLLDLGESARAMPRLILTKELQVGSSAQRFEYAALSYCWGPPSHALTNLKTRKTSVDSFLKAVDFDCMPPAIQDAVSVCRTLSIRYLWVDTLCIIQDDQHDWKREPENMGSVFQNAYVTICALASSSCQQSFLEGSRNLTVVPFRSVVDPTVHGEYVLIHYSAALIDAWPQGDGPSSCPFFFDFESSEWARRGWILQEAHLSQRLLLFGKSRFHFACGHKQISEHHSTVAKRPFSCFPQELNEAIHTISNQNTSKGIYNS